jgi:hypothetical protein
MKKYLLFIFLITSLYTMAQDNELVIKASKKTTKELTPKQIIDSLEKRFPNARAVQYYKTPKAGVRNGWEITEDDELESDRDLDHYTLSFTDNKIKYYGLYRADGSLVMSKLDQSAATLPAAVKESLKQLAGSDYKNWKLVSSSYHKRINHQKNKTYYEVTAVKGSEQKTIYLAPDGTVIKKK